MFRFWKVEQEYLICVCVCVCKKIVSQYYFRSLKQEEDFQKNVLGKWRHFSPQFIFEGFLSGALPFLGWSTLIKHVNFHILVDFGGWSND